MLKIWTDRKGRVHSIVRGSMSQQNTDAMKVTQYLQRRAKYMDKLAGKILDGQWSAQIQSDYNETGMTE